MSAPHESMCISGAGLSSLINVRTEYKDQIPDVSDSTQKYLRIMQF